MKKSLIAAALAMALTGTASAVDFGITGSYDHVSPNYFASGFGLTASQRFGTKGVYLGYDRFPDINYSKYTVQGGLDVATAGSALLTIKSGIAYLDSRYRDGFALLLGVGATFPLTDKLSITADYRHQWGQEKVNKYNGNQVIFGVTYSF
jgi:opacity protein-like surface antigen